MRFVFAIFVPFFVEAVLADENFDLLETLIGEAGHGLTPYGLDNMKNDIPSYWRILYKINAKGQLERDDKKTPFGMCKVTTYKTLEVSPLSEDGFAREIVFHPVNLVRTIQALRFTPIQPEEFSFVYDDSRLVIPYKSESSYKNKEGEDVTTQHASEYTVVNAKAVLEALIKSTNSYKKEPWNGMADALDPSKQV